MTPKVLDLYKEAKSLPPEEFDELFKLFYDDPQIREDMLDLALIMEAEAEGGETVTLDELLAGKRTYDRS
ncbi:MAG: hypothetical protein V2A61_07535 [Calditrichota bacterium]